MIGAVKSALQFGGDQSIAASRGEGKTKIVERLILKHVLSGAVGFAVLFAATGPLAGDSLDAIKSEIEENETLAAYYPEVCDPVIALQDAPQRARGQLVSGKRHDNRKPYKDANTRFRWCGQEIVFPNTPGSPSARAVIATRGLDSAVRGLNKLKRRVDLACIDDPDTEETVNSEEQAGKLEKRIDMAIAGLGNQQRGLTRVMLTTLQNRSCVSFKFTDPTQKPSWQGKRFRFLLKKPDRMDLWERYVEQRKTDQAAGDRHGRTAHAFYLENRAEMEAGAEVANPNRYDGRTLLDGTQIEVSALQRYFNEVAKLGQDAVSCEYDNDPPEECGPVESSLTARRIQRQRSGYDIREIPPGCECVTRGVDVKKNALHWVVRAWRHDEPGWATGYTIEHGITDVHSQYAETESAVDEAIYRALCTLRDTPLERPYQFADGQQLPVLATVIDAGWYGQTIKRFCADAGAGWYPSFGYGKSAGCIRPNFFEPVESSPHKLLYWNCFLTPGPGYWTVHMNSDPLKQWEEDRWMQDPETAGALLLYGPLAAADMHDRMTEADKEHISFSHHIINEKEIEEPYKGGLRRRWRAKGANHWKDAGYRCNVAAIVANMRLYGMPAKPVEDEPVKTSTGWTMPDGRSFL